jgi:hypothetical protein
MKSVAATTFTACLVLGAYAQPAPEYLLYVASEAADRITLLRFDGSTLRVEREVDTGVMPVAIDGPHGLGVSPDGQSFFVSLAHGLPNGALWKYSTSTNTPIGRVALGMFPATLQVSPSGEFVYVVNFNLHGDPVPSSVSVVHADTMLELARIETCRMPHGSRFNLPGTRHYSACMMDEMVVEIDTATLRVSRYFRLASGAEAGGDGPPPISPAPHHDMCTPAPVLADMGPAGGRRRLHLRRLQRHEPDRRDRGGRLDDSPPPARPERRLQSRRDAQWTLPGDHEPSRSIRLDRRSSHRERKGAPRHASQGRPRRRHHERRPVRVRVE